MIKTEVVKVRVLVITYLSVTDTLIKKRYLIGIIKYG
jgi:hypothetical protein